MSKCKPMPTLRTVLWGAQNGECWICSCEMLDTGSNDPRQASLDHLWPKARYGGMGDIGLTMLACRECNTQRGSPIPSDDDVRKLVRVWRGVDRRWLANHVKSAVNHAADHLVKVQRADLLRLLEAA